MNHFVHCCSFQPVIKLLQKGVRVHHRRVILMQKMQKKIWRGGTAPCLDPFSSGEGDTLSPHPAPLGASILTHPILKYCLPYWRILIFALDICLKALTLALRVETLALALTLRCWP